MLGPGKTVGIVGLGGIGAELARLAAAVGLRVVATRRSAVAQQTDVVVETGGGVQATVDLLLPVNELPRLLAESDFVVLCALPMLCRPPSTRHLHNDFALLCRAQLRLHAVSRVV